MPISYPFYQVLLLGNADDIVLHLCRKLGWDLPGLPSEIRPQKPELPDRRSQKRPSEELGSQEPQRVGDSHVWLFEGAEGGQYVENLWDEYRDRAPIGDMKQVKDLCQFQDNAASNGFRSKKMRTE